MNLGSTERLNASGLWAGLSSGAPSLPEAMITGGRACGAPFHGLLMTGSLLGLVLKFSLLVLIGFYYNNSVKL